MNLTAWWLMKSRRESWDFLITLGIAAERHRFAGMRVAPPGST